MESISIKFLSIRAGSWQSPYSQVKFLSVDSKPVDWFINIRSSFLGFRLIFK